MSHSTSLLRVYLKLAMFFSCLCYCSISYASLQITTIPQFSLDLNNPNQEYTEIISFCVFNNTNENNNKSNINYKVNICSSQSNGLFASSDTEKPLKFKLFWKGDQGGLVELYPCTLSSEIFVASNHFNCRGKENVKVKLIIESDWIKDAETGHHSLPLTFNLVPA